MSTFGQPNNLFGSPGTFGEDIPVSNFADFVLKIDLLNFSFSPVPGVAIKAFNVSTQSDLGVIGTTDTNGKIAGAALSGASNGDLVRFRCEDDGEGRRGYAEQIMDSSIGQDIVLRPSSGNVILRPQARPAYYKSPATAPSGVEVFWVVDGDPVVSAQSLGLFPVGQQVRLSQNPTTDRNFWLIPNPVNAFGVYRYASLLDVPEDERYLVVMDRNSSAPRIDLRDSATNTTINLTVSGFGQFIVAREVTTADDAPVNQVETATVVGTITGAGNAAVVVTAAGMNNSPKTLNVAVANSDTASVVAGKIITALQADQDVSTFFTVGGSSANIVLTAITPAANDSTMNLSTANGTCTGLTSEPTSANTTPGAPGFTTNVSVNTFDLTVISNKTFQSLSRSTGLGSTKTFSVKIRHSSKGTSGPWGSYSNVLTLTYPDSGGSGGSTGGGGGDPGDGLPVMELS